MEQQILDTDAGAVARKWPNGLTMVTERLPYLHTVSAGLWIKTGSANESPAQAGVSHLLEHLFFKGTASRTARELVAAVESKGGQFNAFTSREYTCVYVKTLAEHIETGLDVLTDVIRNSQFRQFENERNVVLEEIASIVDVPEEHVHDLLGESMWPDHPLGRPVSGSLESVAALTIDEVRAYYDVWYKPRNMFLAIAGNFDEERLVDQAEAALGDLEPAELPERRPAPEQWAGVAAFERDIAQAHVCMGFPGPRAGDVNRYAYDLLSNILGGGATSRLFEHIREDRGLAYQIYSFCSAYLSAGQFGVYAAVAPQNLEPALDLVFQELRVLRDQPITAAELDDNREQLKGSLLMALESTSARMMRLGKSMMYYGRLIAVDEIVDALDAVQPGHVRDLAAQVFEPEQCTLTLLGPVSEAAHTPVML